MYTYRVVTYFYCIGSIGITTRNVYTHKSIDTNCEILFESNPIDTNLFEKIIYAIGSTSQHLIHVVAQKKKNECSCHMNHVHIISSGKKRTIEQYCLLRDKLLSHSFSYSNWISYTSRYIRLKCHENKTNQKKKYSTDEGKLCEYSSVVKCMYLAVLN